MPITLPFEMNFFETAESTVECRESKIINAREYRKMIWRRRLMALATLSTMVGIFVYTTALLLPTWATIDFVNHRREHVRVLLGVWAEWISHFPVPASDRYLRLAGVYLKHYYRVQAAFSVIALLLMISSNLLALYTFTHHRYMYKRLVAALFIIVAMCIVVSIEVLTNSINEWNLEVVEKSMQTNDWDYTAGQKTGYPVFMAWLVAGIYLLATIAFVRASHKQKGSKAATAEFEIEDRPVHLYAH